VTNCNFTHNKASSSGSTLSFGGAIRMYYGSVTNCNFTNNSAPYGGAIRFIGKSTVTNCNFIGNIVTSYGGAIYTNSSTITNCNFTNNSASSGGAIRFSGEGSLTNCNFVNNTAKNGGAVYFFNNGNVTNCNFTDNSATNGNGGAIYMNDGTVTNCNFVNNTASNKGGAIYFNIKLGTITNCSFTNNSNPEVYPIPKKETPIIITAPDIIVGNDAVITVSLPGDINGILNITIGGFNRTSDIKNGTATVQIAGLAIGDYNVVAWFGGNENYLPNSTSKMFSVSLKYKESLTVTTQKNADEGYIQLTVPADITGNLTLEIDGKTHSINPENNKIDLRDLSTGNYTFSITYPGDDKYNSYSSSDYIYLTKTATELTITANDTTYGNGGKITVSLSQNITGSVNFTLLDNESVIDTKTSVVINGTATYLIPELNVGRYTLKAQSAGDTKHYKSDLYSASFKVAPKISITPDVVIGDDGIITMELGDVSGVIAVSVDGELDGSKKIAEGKFIYALSTWVLLVGNHTLTFEYTGNSFDKNIFNYWDNETASYKPIEYRFHIAPKQTETKSDSDNDNLFEIILEDENGTVLSNATGQIVVEIINQFTQEVEHIIIDVINGIATLDISKFKDGNYLIRWNYLGDGKHTPISKQLTLTITHKPSGISASDLTLLYTSKATYYVTVYTGSGEGISGVPVTFLINNRVVKTVTTDSRGVAGISISQNPGSYHITAKADALRITRILTVTHLLSLKTVKVKKSAKKLVLTASLKKINGKYLKGKKITFKFNGKKYTAKTNKKGVCKLTIKSKVLKKLKAGKKVTYQATYLKDTVKKSVKIRK